MSAEKAKLIKFSKPGLLIGGMSAIDFGIGTFSNIKEGHGVLPSIAKAGVSTLASDIMYGMLGPAGQAVLIGGMLANAGANLAIKAGQSNLNDISGALSDPMMKGKTPINSKNAVTMRQRGMAMINQSGEATRSALGSEARAYFRNSMY